MGEKYVVPLKEAITGVLHGRAGTFRILIDEEISGAKHFSLLVNTMNAGVTGDEHKHDVEHCWYILSGRGTMFMAGKAFPLEPEMAVFAPVNMLHKIVVGPDEDLTYIVVYAPPGPEQQLKKLGEHAFDAPKQDLEIGIVGAKGVITIDDTHRDLVLASEKPQWAGYRPEGYHPEHERHVEFLTSFPPGDIAYGQIWGPIREETHSWFARLHAGIETPHATVWDGHRNLVLTMAMGLSAEPGVPLKLPIDEGEFES